MKKMKLNAELLLDVASLQNRETRNIRMNKQLSAYVTRSAKKKGMKLVDYYNKLILSVIIYEKNGIDILDVIKDMDSEF